jgi:predicted N-acetyltransferase YhbS/REP element-mobilizing transposase RayT
MNLTEGELYHVFNRGNNSQKIFFRPENYAYFVSGMRKHLLPVCDIIAWCLMPNHFHFLVYANAHSTPVINDGGFERQQFSQGIKQLLSSYTKAINKQENRTGSLFQQKTKALPIDAQTYTPETVLHYIHQNPMRAGLVRKMEDWEYSSFSSYSGSINDFLCNKEIASRYLEVNPEQFYQESYRVINSGDEGVLHLQGVGHLIQPATTADVPALNKLVNSAYRGESSRKGWATEADLIDGTRIDEAAMLDLIHDKNTTILKYTEDEMILGCVELRKENENLYLGMLSVQPDLQAKGIGKKLMFAGEDFARKQGCKKVTMTVVSVREKLIDWYIRHGYRLTGERKPFKMPDERWGIPKQPLEFVFMEKAL